MKNYTTPRTLADCEFVTGNPIVDFQRRTLGLVGWLVFGAVSVLVLDLLLIWGVCNA